MRKSGMEGFYANLLTKNVAMGGDVDKNAVSVYTAGSARQSHLLSEPQVPSAAGATLPAQSSTSGSSSSGGGGVSHSASSGSRTQEAEKEAASAHDDHEDDSRILDKSRNAGSAEQPRKAQRIAEQSPADTDAVSELPMVSSVKPTVPVVDKVEQIMSAKDRYLARKRALDQATN